jgi:hypothetical protein
MTSDFMGLREMGKTWKIHPAMSELLGGESWNSEYSQMLQGDKDPARVSWN